MKLELPNVQILTDNDKITCQFCQKPKNVLLHRLRQHIASHIILKEIDSHSHLCGYCGLIGCSLDLVVTSGKGKNKTFGPKSDCKYFRALSYRCAETSSTCTNRPVKCKICNNIYWSNNLETPYKDSHSRFVKDLPKQISDEEILVLSKSSFL
jgi:hypothetical protein